MDDTKNLRDLLKTASHDLRASRDVIEAMADRIQELEHQQQATEVALKLASLGQVQASELSEKVAELCAKSGEELELEAKVASYQGSSGHSLHSQKTAEGGTSALSFLS